MINYKQALLENKDAEDELKMRLKEYSDHLKGLAQGVTVEPYRNIAQEEPVLPLAEAEKQLDDELLKQSNEMTNKYPSGYEKRFAKTKQYLNKI